MALKAPTAAVLIGLLAVPTLFLAVFLGGRLGAALALLALAGAAFVVSVALGGPDGDGAESDASSSVDDDPGVATPAPATERDGRCERCGAPIGEGARYCGDCSTVGSWRK